MNFADFYKQNSSYSQRPETRDSFENWKKPFSMSEITHAIADACYQFSEETRDPTIMVLGMMITADIHDKLFPEEELKQYMESQEGDKQNENKK